MIMNKEELIDECVRYIADDVWKKDVLTYKEQDEYKEYLNTIIETITKEKDKEIERLNNIINELEKYLFSQLQEYGGGGLVQEYYDKLKELKNK